MRRVSGSSPRAGRPRDGRIEPAVLKATVELLETVGYLQVSVGAIALRAGTTKPAIYRRWRTKAHLVHDAVFPALDLDDIPVDQDLRADIQALVVTGVELLGRPAARAALPGLLAESAADAGLQAEVLLGAASSNWVWLERRLQERVEAGEVRRDVKPSVVFELIAGASFIAAVTRPPGGVDAEWTDDVVDVIMRAITP